MWFRYSLIALLVGSLIGLATACGGGVDPALGARLIYEEELTDNIKAQIILADDDILNEDEDRRYHWGY